MDTCFPDWNTDPISTHRNPLGSEDELVELLWQDGEVVLNTQTNNRKHQSRQPHNPNTLIQDYEPVSWADCPIDEAFEREFFANILSEIPPAEPSSQVKNDGNLQLPVKGQTAIERGPVAEHSVRTVNSSHCASNQDMGMSLVGGGSKEMPVGVEVKHGRNVSRSIADKEMLRQDFLNQCNETDSRKRKNRDAEDSECRSDATELESVAGNKSSQKPGIARKSRVAEVHNMSERRRRDRINERMKALQELIPHSNKSDKASMLDEAIEYMKSLQWQLQMMWMGSGMTPMMVPSMQHYMSRFRMGMGPPMLPTIQNSRPPIVGQGVSMDPRTNQAFLNYHNHMHMSYMGFPNGSQQLNSFNYGIHSPQQNTVLTPPEKANGSHGS